MGRKPNWLKNLEAGGGKYHEPSGASVWPNGHINGDIVISKSNGYLTFFKNGRSWKLHRVVAECFIPNPENKPVVNHIDGNKGNSKVENLEWATHKENSQHAYNTGLSRYKPRRKFTKREIMYIRMSEVSFYKLAEKYGVSYWIIYNIHYLKTHKNII